jgi:hypothetical protein
MESRKPRSAPSVTELQSKLLRLARDNGGWVSENDAPLGTIRACQRKAWLAPRDGKKLAIMPAGRAALAYFDAHGEQEKLWDRTCPGWRTNPLA